MNEQEVRTGVMAAIKAVAPEVEESALAADRLLRDQVDLDSMDWLNVIVGFHERFGIDIPETDYARLTTLSAIATYVLERLAKPGRAAVG
jgi:acyl carrier protein